MVGRYEIHQQERREEELRELRQQLRWEQRQRLRGEMAEPPVDSRETDCAA